MTPIEQLADAKRKAKPDAKCTPRPVLFRCSLRERRKALGLSQRAIGEAIGMLGGYSQIERGCGVTLETAFKLAQFFGTSIEELWTPVATGEKTA